VTVDPVGQILTPRSVRKGVGTGSEYGHKERGRFGFTGFAIVDGNASTGPVHEGFFAGTVVLA
jgi:hypothetical protein